VAICLGDAIPSKGNASIAMRGSIRKKLAGSRACVRFSEVISRGTKRSFIKSCTYVDITFIDWLSGARLRSLFQQLVEKKNARRTEFEK
jgi:hypothetical protein